MGLSSIDDFLKTMAIKYSKEDIIEVLKYHFKLTEDEAIKRYDKWQKEWCEPIINKEF